MPDQAALDNIAKLRHRATNAGIEGRQGPDGQSIVEQRPVTTQEMK